MKPVRPRSRAPRPAVAVEPLLAHDLEHGLPRVRGDVGPVVQDAGDGRDRDAGEIGDVADRGAAAEAGAVGVEISLCHLEDHGNGSGTFAEAEPSIKSQFSGETG